MRRYHRFTFRVAIAAVLLPVFVLMIVMLALFASASVEFGAQAGFRAVQNAILPVLLLTALLFCGFYSFYIEWIDGAPR